MSRRPAVRFRPPALRLTPAVRWMLLRAFGPAGAVAPAAEAGEVLALCRRFDVSARVAARQGRARLAAEMGAAAEGFARDQAAAAAQGLRLMALADRVAAEAAARDLPLVFLKFAAMELGRLLAPGGRRAWDLDVLVPGGSAEELQETLVRAGFRASSMPGQEHQLPALAGPEGIVEVHRMLPGVRVRGRRSATFEDLAGEGLLAPLPRLPGRASIPAPAVAAAHVLVHGIAQHGWSPASYPPFRMVADLIDLGFCVPAERAEHGVAPPAGEALARVTVWLAGEVTAGEVAAVGRLVAALAAGAELDGWAESPAGEALLLRHMLAGSLDPRYERSLRLSLLRRQPSDRREPARLARALLAAVWLSRPQVDAIYGPPRRRLGYLARRLARPFDLFLRLAASCALALRLRWRRPA
ncbi:MAG TPA: nucleotidyltransferase family protein [Thermoanaerobaculia bacterium]|nr:nucleotidyltransferase family protein [Thermoanaerobaculia bacterium]